MGHRRARFTQNTAMASPLDVLPSFERAAELMLVLGIGGHGYLYAIDRRRGFRMLQEVFRPARAILAVLRSGWGWS